MNELISIIIPVYNSAKYLEKCLESIRATGIFLGIFVALVREAIKSRRISTNHLKS